MNILFIGFGYLIKALDDSSLILNCRKYFLLVEPPATNETALQFLWRCFYTNFFS